MKTKLYLLLAYSWMVVLQLAASNQHTRQGGILKDALGFEKLYVQTDKSYYNQDETIWYKLFLVNAKDNKTSATSEVAYVELHDPKGNIILSREHQVMDGTCNGEMALEGNYPGGLYKLVAYTRWMKNEGEESFFRKELTVQKVITPRLLLKIDFEKRAYGAGDEVEAKLDVTDLNNIPATGAQVKADVRIKGVQVKTVTTQTEKGKGSIRFTLPEKLDTADGILQVIVDYNGVNESITRSIPIVLDKIELSFYPEGGEIIEGFSNRVAFEALNEFGKGADVSGHILDEAGNKVTTFESFHMGMGAFELKPEVNKKYYAKILTPQGNDRLMPLPVAATNGYGMKLEAKEEKKTIWTFYAPKEVKNARLIGRTHGEVYYDQPVQLKQGSNRIEVNITGFPAGIAVFTLLDENAVEQAERLVFINSFKTLSIEISTPDVQIPGEEGCIKVITKDEKGNPVSADIGISVVDEQLMTFADDKQDHIISYLLMSSDLKGKIEEPSFYFDKKEEKAEQALDYLLLTHGWRRFVLKDLVDPETGVFKEMPERVTSLYGTVLNAKGKPVRSAEVFLVEIFKKKRIVPVRTDHSGQFVFHNVDLSAQVYLVTRKPNYVSLEITPTAKMVQGLLGEATSDLAEYTVGAVVPVEEIATEIEDLLVWEPNMMEEEWMNLDSEPVLEDVVVTGYGAKRASSLTGAMKVVSHDEINLLNYYSKTDFLSYNSLMIGTVPGFRLNRSTNSGMDILLNESGLIASGYAGDLMVVLDGYPVYRPASKALSYANPGVVGWLMFINNNQAGARYGSRGANGVLFVGTGKNYLQTTSVYRKPRYNDYEVKERIFYKPATYQSDYHNKDGLQSTVAWQGNIQTDDEGEAFIYVKNGKQTSAFRVTVEGIDMQTGLVGHKIHHYITEKPLSVDVKVPVMAATTDHIKVPVLIRNTTPDSISGVLEYVLGEQGEQRSGFSWQEHSKVTIAPTSTQTVYVSLDKIGRSGDYEVGIRFIQSGEKKAEVIFRPITIQEVYFPMSYSWGSRDLQKSDRFNIPEYIPGTLNGQITVYSSVLDELIDGVESIFRAPYGCFEQVSSSTMPNIFALQLLNTVDKSNPEVRAKALKYLEDGYRKLAAYEVRGGGFEWYGGTPAHTVLSAYGLLEFAEMQKVYPHVDKNMLDRTYQYLMGRKNNKGGFLHHRGKYGFSGAPDVVGDAYVVYALVEAGYKDNLDKEYQQVLQEALGKKDLYRMALVANAAYELGDKEGYTELVNYFRQYLARNSFTKINPQATIVYSYGETAARETAAFWLMALLKAENPEIDLVEKCLGYISKGKQDGGFGTTQTTSVCLQALTRYVEKTGFVTEDASLQVVVNGYELSRKILKTMKTVVDFTYLLDKGNNSLDLSFKDATTGYPYGLDITWYSQKPPASPLCPLQLSTKLASRQLKVNETVRLTVTLKNKEQAGKPMSIAIIGIPGGLSLQPWQLKELQDKEVYDYYEIIDENLVIYYREMGPAEVKTINLDLKAEIPGTYRGIASSAYQYYMNDHKYWINGMEVEVLPAE